MGSLGSECGRPHFVVRTFLHFHFSSTTVSLWCVFAANTTVRGLHIGNKGNPKSTKPNTYTSVDPQGIFEQIRQ